MFKTAVSIGLFGIILILTACASTNKTTIVGELNTPINYTYAPGYSPTQVAYPGIPQDSTGNIDSASTIQYEKAMNARNNSLAAAQKQKEAAEQKIMEQIRLQQLNSNSSINSIIPDL